MSPLSSSEHRPIDTTDHYYSICGMLVATTLPLPAAAALPGQPDIIVRDGRVPDFESEPDCAGPTWQVLGRNFLLDVPQLLRMRVEDGRTILVEPASGVPPAEVAPFILSTGLGTLLHQRGVLAFHGATVAIDGKGLVLCGASGAGKSTLAAALCAGGATFIADDITTIDPASPDAPRAIPDGRQHRLWGEAVQQLNLTGRRGEPVREHLRKFHVRPLADQNHPGSARLGAIVLLQQRPFVSPPAPPVVEPLDIVDAAPLLRAQVFKPTLASSLGRDALLFGQIARLVSQVPVFRLEFSLGFDRLPETITAVRALMETPG